MNGDTEHLAAPAGMVAAVEAPCSSAAGVLIVANPYSGARENRRLVEELAAELRRRGLQPRVVWDRQERQTLLSDPALPNWCRCIVAAGGDGTVADVLNDQPAAPVAILPLGNENLLACELGMTRNITALAQAVAAGRCRTLDLGLAAGRRFSLMIGVGLDAEVVHRVRAWRAGATSLRRVRRVNYLRPILGALCNYAHPMLEIEADGQTVRGAHAFIFNLPRYGVGLPFLPDACGDDGLLDWIVFQRCGRLSAAGYLFDVLRGAHRRRRDVLYGRAARIRISSATPAPVQFDGDAAGFTPLEVTVLPAAARMIVP